MTLRVGRERRREGEREGGREKESWGESGGKREGDRDSLKSLFCPEKEIVNCLQIRHMLFSVKTYSKAIGSII